MTILTLGLGGVFIAMTGFLGYQLKKTNDKLMIQENTLEQILHEFNALCSTQQGFGQRLIEAEKSIKKLIAQRQSIQNPLNPPQSLFTQAKKLLMLGASLEDVEKTCGLSKSEAKLIAMTFDLSSESTVDMQDKQEEQNTP